MYLDELKKKLRSLKKLETTIRFGSRALTGREKFIWDRFFSTKENGNTSVKYSLKQLLKMDREEIKEVFDEFFYHVYFQYYTENGITLQDLYDPNLLSILGLSQGATLEDIKQRFRELALEFHPDRGGDSEKFIEILDVYKRLTDNHQ